MALSAAIAKAYAEVGNGAGRVAALPENTVVRAFVNPTKKDTTFIEKVQFAKQGPNAQIPAWNMRFVVPQGYQHANKNFFARVPRAYFITGQKGQVPAYLTMQLFKALGYTDETLQDDTPQKLTDREIFGKPVDLVLGVQEDFKWGDYLAGLSPEERQEAEQKAAANPLYKQINTIKFINAPKASTGKTVAAVPAGAGAGAPAPVEMSDPWAPTAPIADASAGEEDPWANFDPAQNVL